MVIEGGQQGTDAEERAARAQDAEAPEQATSTGKAEPSSTAVSGPSVVRGGGAAVDGCSEPLRWVPYSISAGGVSATGSFRPPEPPTQEVLYGPGPDASPIPPEGYRPHEAPPASSVRVPASSVSPVPGPDPAMRYAPWEDGGGPWQPASAASSEAPAPPSAYAAYVSPTTPPPLPVPPASAVPPNAADRNVAAVLAILFGAFGVHKFYLRYYVPAFLMLGITLLGGFVSLPLMSWAVWVVAIVEGVIYLTKSQAQFYQIYVANRREWF